MKNGVIVYVVGKEMHDEDCINSLVHLCWFCIFIA